MHQYGRIAVAVCCACVRCVRLVIYDVLPTCAQAHLQYLTNSRNWPYLLVPVAPQLRVSSVSHASAYVRCGGAIMNTRRNDLRPARTSDRRDLQRTPVPRLRAQIRRIPSLSAIYISTVTAAPSAGGHIPGGRQLGRPDLKSAYNDFAVCIVSECTMHDSPAD